MEDLFYDRVRNILLAQAVGWTEKKMMGGITFMVDDKMCFGSFQGALLCRIDPTERDELLEAMDVDIVKQNGREMKGYVQVQLASLETDEALAFWIGKCLAFNPKAKASKKKKP